MKEQQTLASNPCKRCGTNSWMKTNSRCVEGTFIDTYKCMSATCVNSHIEVMNWAYTKPEEALA